MISMPSKKLRFWSVDIVVLLQLLAAAATATATRTHATIRIKVLELYNITEIASPSSHVLNITAPRTPDGFFPSVSCYDASGYSVQFFEWNSHCFSSFNFLLRCLFLLFLNISHLSQENGCLGIYIEIFHCVLPLYFRSHDLLCEAIPDFRIISVVFHLLYMGKFLATISWLLLFSFNAISIVLNACCLLVLEMLYDAAVSLMCSHGKLLPHPDVVFGIYEVVCCLKWNRISVGCWRWIVCCIEKLFGFLRKEYRKWQYWFMFGVLRHLPPPTARISI